MAEQPAQTTNKQLLLQKIYLKDLSFESPKAPEVFNSNAAPQTQLNMRSSAREVGPNSQEVTLTLTVEAKHNDTTLFLVEVAQAGVFTIQGYNEQERAMLIGSYCPSTLYPYAREAISDTVVKGGFPQLLLQPINFEALYAQAMQQRAEQGGAPIQPFGTAPQGEATGSAPGSSPGQADTQSANSGETH